MQYIILVSSRSRKHQINGYVFDDEIIFKHYNKAVSDNFNAALNQKDHDTEELVSNLHRVCDGFIRDVKIGSNIYRVQNTPYFCIFCENNNKRYYAMPGEDM